MSHQLLCATYKTCVCTPGHKQVDNKAKQNETQHVNKTDLLDVSSIDPFVCVSRWVCM